MTDRIASLVVVLKQDMRVDDVEDLKKAIRMIRGVEAVRHGPVVDYEDLVARERITRELREALFKILDPTNFEIIEKARLR